MRLVEGTATVADVDALVADLADIAEGTGTTVQAFDARYVAGRRHLERAVELADRARERGEAIARDRGMEIMLYAAGRRQITDALTMGVDAGESPVVVLVDGDGTPGPDADGDEAAAAAAVEDLLAPGETLGSAAEPALIADYFGITDAERAATDADLLDLVCERCALLTVDK